MVVQTIVGPVIETLTNKKLSRAFLYYFPVLFWPACILFRAEPKEKLLCGVKSFQLWNFMFSASHVTEWNGRPIELHNHEFLRLGNIYLDFKIDFVLRWSEELLFLVTNCYITFSKIIRKQVTNHPCLKK